MIVIHPLHQLFVEYNYIAFHIFQGWGENSLFVDQRLTQLQSGVSGMKTSSILDFLVNISVTLKLHGMSI